MIFIDIHGELAVVDLLLRNTSNYYTMHIFWHSFCITRETVRKHTNAKITLYNEMLRRVADAPPACHPCTLHRTNCLSLLQRHYTDCPQTRKFALFLDVPSGPCQSASASDHGCIRVLHCDISFTEQVNNERCSSVNQAKFSCSVSLSYF